ncbi:MAG: hypothetical protein CO187_07995 [Zetaproteobacteria bacterium CG_4_9_14_3_um_filter_53_7]|nr:MAG: hypothetical protein CO187_07995 [Zetaproteobacteria bacterium CG_4_9_14_3_um_filter_53_7]
MIHIECPVLEIVLKLLNLCLISLLSACLPFVAYAERDALSWTDAGWQQMQQKDNATAMNIWQQGVNTLPDKQLLGSLGTFSGFANALDTIERAGREEHVFIIRTAGRHGWVYNALTAQPITRDIEMRQLEMAALKQRVGIEDKLLANEAGKFKQKPAADYALTIQPAAAGQHVKTTALVAKRTYSPRSSAAAYQPIMAVASTSFTINSFEVEGNKRVSTDTILLSLRDYYGSDKTSSEFRDIKRQIIDIYNMEHVYNVKVNTPRFIEDDTVLISITEM